ncbi:MAG: alpha/beta fold hydrolase [Corynebacterium sp.]|uniref:esterase/lipase family protein n=1 Tax=Corynebacterium TaxID=1716 RepID=UPI0026477C15|nr:alpha/beta fold hydrolase [Corynebacterium sp.]MDN6283304.1 alpha/beta fold hydrolase [Corynebacterium sp.]MDN6305975.1 alpha/beta fold hydrolase [Corynebacterium sp.]MDN6353009.1 alpha/beta fold hydrolase [Corynebacterium sp.]MDN6366905.1 alpha/beta fold hydrolase [Corynebacterium sp.]MDN6375671.1 alpha/beta fold hydrolase [Corynebacterium sp.]
MPDGVNDWNCELQDDRDTVVLIHGTWEKAYDNWAAVAPALAADGHCVYATNHGKGDILNKGGVGTLLPNAFGTEDIADSGAEIATFVDRVLAATGAEQVDLVGHSQGGLLARQYLKFNGGAAKTDHVVTLGATNHGTTMSGIGNLDRFIGQLGLNLDPILDHVVGEAGIQQLYGSPLLKRLNADGDTVPGVDYTAVATKYDEVTTPYHSTFLEAEEGSTVNNVTVQDGCAADNSDHISMSYSPRVIDIVRDALVPGSAPDGEKACTPNSPIMGAGTVEPTEFLTGPFGWLSENMHPLPENAVPGS